MRIRDAHPLDAAALLEIYAPYVSDTTVSFELEVPDVATFARRIEQALRTHAWLVAENGAGPLGYAYGSTHRSRAAYRFAVEVSVYVAQARQGEGVGSRLYAALFERLRRRGYFRAYGGVTLPNDPSIAFHRALGFEPVGEYRRVGFKHGRWHDVSWWSLDLQEGDPGREVPG